jgi:hypothetical protein
VIQQKDVEQKAPAHHVAVTLNEVLKKLRAVIRV